MTADPAAAARPPAPLPPPLPAPVPVPPDRDFAAIVAQGLARLPELAPGWTDHNPSDPGITLLEADAFALADLHYRIANRPLTGWSAQAALFRDPAARHWSGAALPADPARLAALADALAALPATVVAAVRRAVAPRDAEQAVADAAPGLDAGEIRAAVRLLRVPLVLRVALDASDAIAAGLAAAGPGAAEASVVAELRALGLGPDLWDEELAAAARRTRAAGLAATLRDAAARVRELVEAAADRAGAEAALAAEFGLDAEQARDAMGAHPAPAVAVPEDWERPGGATTAWPPHPLQARTGEPVTLPDYARLALGAVDRTDPARPVAVRRAWAVPEILAGIGFDGAPTVPAGRPGAVTILVEPDDPDAIGTPARRAGFLRAVLRHALAGPGEVAEVDDPYAPAHLDLDRLAPRRLICDEVAAAVLETCPVTVRGVVYVPAGASRPAVLAGAMGRIGELFATGRPESAAPPPAVAPAYPRDLDGPWPAAPVALPLADPGSAPGWLPGEPVRIAELVQAIMRDPGVLGVDDLAARAGGGGWQAEELPLPAGCVPVLADRQCLTVTLELREECGDGC